MRTPLTLVIAAAIAVVAAGSQSASAKGPDIAAGKLLRLGTGARAVSVPWGGSVRVNDTLADSVADGKCTFDLTYDVSDTADSAEGAFKNHVLVNGVIAAVNSSPVLLAGQPHPVRTQVALVPGMNELEVQLDAGRAIAESNEANNDMSVKVAVTGACRSKDPRQADLAVPQGLAIGGSVGGIGSRQAQWNGNVTLRTAEVALASAGKCAFNIMYRVENRGAAASGAFTDRIFAGASLVSEQQLGSIEPGGRRTVITQAYLRPGPSTLRLEVNGADNAYAVDVNVDADCNAVPRRS
ncbi:MAG TPA: CARDB domain-containing protein [Telluria sp.]|nr:CARDB domain-containing protein [Telluria sp.]